MRGRLLVRSLLGAPRLVYVQTNGIRRAFGLESEIDMVWLEGVLFDIGEPVFDDET